jgi:hypothetical protein
MKQRGTAARTLPLCSACVWAGKHLKVYRMVSFLIGRLRRCDACGGERDGHTREKTEPADFYRPPLRRKAFEHTCDDLHSRHQFTAGRGHVQLKSTARFHCGSCASRGVVVFSGGRGLASAGGGAVARWMAIGYRRHPSWTDMRVAMRACGVLTGRYLSMYGTYVSMW